MGIELPAELTDIAARTGVKWPDADEDKMREVAQAWRDSGEKINALVSEADGTARSALGTTEGASADAARRHWGTYVQPDTGHLTKLAKGCTANADKLDHAANQVGQAKVAIVRELTPLAKNVDVAEHSGDPSALLGLDTALRGAAANLAGLHSTLVSAVQPTSGVLMDTVQPIVNTTPGATGQNLLAQTTGLVDGAGKAVSAMASPLVDGVANTAQTITGSPSHGPGLVAPLVDGAAGAAQSIVGGSGHGPGVVAPIVDSAAGAAQSAVGGPGSHGPGAGPPVAGNPGGHGPGGLPVVGDVAGAVSPIVSGPGGHGPPGVDVGHPGGPGHGQPVLDPGFGPGQVHGGPGGSGGHGPGGVPSWTTEPVTGPLPSLGDAPTPPSGFHRPDHSVHLAGASAVLDAPPAAQQPLGQQAPSGIPAQAQVNQPPVAPPAPATPFVGGGAPPPASPPPQGAGPVPVAAGQPAVPPQQQQAPRGPVPLVPPQVTAEPVRQQAPPPAAPLPAPAAEKPEQDRDSVIALWLVRMFPIGHMPVAAARPARQLPPPSAEFDYAAGMRFEPGDHPRSDLVDDSPAMAGSEVVEPGPSIPAGDLTLGHDPLAGQNERDWARRFVVREGSGRDTVDTEYAWPPSELFPEGGTAPGEPEVLEPDTVLDRFGTSEGRVFAAADTPFAQRSLPPSHVNAEYRRYRVLRPLPVWRGVCAAWFGQTGGGVRYRTTHPALDLIALGYLAEETGNEG
nr:TNT domain-containing protein [Kibdelosporangium sp. MJ126-NF4]CEL22138.1 Translation initiation factor IF-2 [Kibdelosporangium sp. MJ126-NF4]CTQ92919.1 Translation initiation factor IF-2 [Kibdelosporangium sp. MJ126-NF4]